MSYQYYLLAIVCIGTCFSAEEVTHMPTIKEQKLDPRIVEELKNETESPSCREEVEESTRRMINSHAVKKLTAPISPCETCRFQGYETFTLPNLKARRLGYKLGDPYIIHGFPIFGELKIICESCHIVDDSGRKDSGSITGVWTNGEVELVVYVPEQASRKVDILLLNATNVNRDTVQVTCSGEAEFESICTKTHQKGELDHMMQNAAELLFETKIGPGKKSLVASCFNQCDFEEEE